MIFKVSSLALGCFLGAFLGNWIADRDPPSVTTLQRPLNSPVRPGSELLVQYHVKRYRSCSTSIDRFIFDAQGVRTILDDLEFKTAPSPLGDSVFTAPVPIPRTISEGRAVYRINATYVCNPLHRFWPITVEGREIPFDVAGPPVEP